MGVANDHQTYLLCTLIQLRYFFPFVSRFSVNGLAINPRTENGGLLCSIGCCRQAHRQFSSNSAGRLRVGWLFGWKNICRAKKVPLYTATSNPFLAPLMPPFELIALLFFQSMVPGIKGMSFVSSTRYGADAN